MMPFLKDTWYLAAWQKDLLVGQPLARTLCGICVLLYRTPEGKPVAMQDRCAHRLAPLSRGKIEADRVICGYHGLQYGPDGRCVHNPYGKIPKAAFVQTYPLVEKHHAIWIWLGESPADETMIPDFSILDQADGAAAMRRDHVVFHSPWDHIADNLIDLSHVSFLHDGILGSTETIDAANVVEAQGENTLTVTREYPNRRPPGMLDMLFRQDGQPVDSWMRMRWTSPAAFLLDFGGTGVGRPRDEGTGYFGVHILTPETERTTHYHFAATRWNIRPDSETPEMREKISDLRRFAFAEQDEPMIAAQAQIWEEAGVDQGKVRPVWLDIDVGVARWRKRVQEQLEAEKKRNAERTNGHLANAASNPEAPVS